MSEEPGCPPKASPPPAGLGPVDAVASGPHEASPAHRDWVVRITAGCGKSCLAAVLSMRSVCLFEEIDSGAAGRSRYRLEWRNRSLQVRSRVAMSRTFGGAGIWRRKGPAKIFAVEPAGTLSPSGLGGRPRPCRTSPRSRFGCLNFWVSLPRSGRSPAATARRYGYGGSQLVGARALALHETVMRLTAHITDGLFHFEIGVPPPRVLRALAA